MSEMVTMSRWRIERMVGEIPAIVTDQGVRTIIADWLAKAPADVRDEAIEYALKVHHDNQEIYGVCTSYFGPRRDEEEI